MDVRGAFEADDPISLGPSDDQKGRRRVGMKGGRRVRLLRGLSCTNARTSTRGSPSQEL